MWGRRHILFVVMHIVYSNILSLIVFSIPFTRSVCKNVKSMAPRMSLWFVSNKLLLMLSIALPSRKGSRFKQLKPPSQVNPTINNKHQCHTSQGQLPSGSSVSILYVKELNTVRIIVLACLVLTTTFRLQLQLNPSYIQASLSHQGQGVARPYEKRRDGAPLSL